MARLWVLSDIHDDNNAATLGRPLRLPRVEADVLVLAGDVCGRIAKRGLRWILDQRIDVPIVLVAGNHDYWTGDLLEEIDRFKHYNRDNSIHILDGEAIEIAGARFVGATLWTDYAVRSEDGRAAAMKAAELRMVDHRQIRTLGYRRKIAARDLLSQHERQLAEIEAHLAKPFDGPTVVVTHHAPSPRSLQHGVATDDLDGAYASNLEALIMRTQPELWIHGHVHHRCDYWIGETRVLANPRGYVERLMPRTRLHWEDSDWDPRLVVGVGADRQLRGGPLVEHDLDRPSLAGPLPLASTDGLDADLADEVECCRRYRPLPAPPRPPAPVSSEPLPWTDDPGEPPEDEPEIDLAAWRP